MKRTKDGGAILQQNDEEVKLTKAEFLQSRLIRDLGRIGIICIAGVIDFIIIKSNGLLTIRAVFLMLGWRLKVGW